MMIITMLFRSMKALDTIVEFVGKEVGKDTALKGQRKARIRQPRTIDVRHGR